MLPHVRAHRTHSQFKPHIHMTPDQLSTGNTLAKELQFLYSVRDAIKGANCITLGEGDSGKKPFKLGNYFSDLFYDGGALDKALDSAGAVTFNYKSAGKIQAGKPEQYNQESLQAASFVMGFSPALDVVRAVMLAHLDQLIDAKEKEFKAL